MTRPRTLPEAEQDQAENLGGDRCGGHLLWRGAERVVGFFCPAGIALGSGPHFVRATATWLLPKWGSLMMWLDERGTA